MAWIKATQDTPGAFSSWNGEGYDWWIDQPAGILDVPSTRPMVQSGTENTWIANPVYNLNATSDIAAADAKIRSLGGGLDWNAYNKAVQAGQAARGQTIGTGASGSGGLYGQGLQQLMTSIGMTPNDMAAWQSSLGSDMSIHNNPAGQIASMLQYKGIDPNSPQAQAQINQLSGLWNAYQGEQTNLNKDHGLGTFLTLLALGVGGGALAAGGFGAGVGANAAGAMGIEAGAAGGAGSGLAAGAGGAFDMGGLAGTGIPESWGLGAGADLSAGWGVTQGGGMDADLLALLDSPAGGGGSLGDWWSQALGTGSNYSASDLANILGVGGGSSGGSGSSWLDYLRQGSSAVNSVSGLFKDNPLLGAALGGLAGSLNGSKQAGTTTVTNEPWAAQQPYLLAGFQGALNTLGQTAPSNTLGPANQGLLSTIRGDYLNANPYLDATYQRAAAQVLPGVEGYFSRAGRTGSNSAANALGDTSVKLATDIYGQNYARERGLQNSAILNAPSFSQGVTNAQYAPISQYMQAIGANRGSQQNTPYYDNPLGSILSGAMTGYGLSRYL